MRSHWTIGLLGVLIFAVFGQALMFGFAPMDDFDVLTGNKAVLNFDIPAMIVAKGLEFIPLTFLSLAFDHWLFGLNPAGFHAANLLIHFLVCIGIWALTLRIFPGRGDLATSCAFIFAIHPVHVEPVVWIASRKDLLYSGFVVAALIAYWEYWREPRETRRRARYALVNALGALALFAKGGALVVVPLLVWADFFARRKPSVTAIFDKLPLLLLSAWVAVRHLRSHKSIARIANPESPLMESASNALQSPIFYVSKWLLPARLSAYYESAAVNLIWLDYAIFLLALAASVGVCWKMRSLRRPLLLALAFCLIAISPYLKLVPYGKDFAFADRYLYLAAYGLTLAFLLPLLSLRRGALIAGALTVACAAAAAQRTSIWSDERKLIDNILENYPRTSYAYVLRAYADHRAGDDRAELINLHHAVALAPSNYDRIFLLGNAYAHRGEFARAIELYERALPLNRGELHTNLANAYGQVGRFDEMERHLMQALNFEHVKPIAHVNLAIHYRQRLRMEESKSHLLESLKAAPEWRVPAEELARHFELSGDSQSARHYRELAQRLSPDPSP